MLARGAGDAFETITGADLMALSLDRPPPSPLPSGPTDDQADANVTLDSDEGFVWPDPDKVAAWWNDNGSRFRVGTSYFLGTPKQSVDWIGALQEATQRRRRAAALELALQRPGQALFEVRAGARLQQRLLRQVRPA